MLVSLKKDKLVSLASNKTAHSTDKKAVTTPTPNTETSSCQDKNSSNPNTKKWSISNLTPKKKKPNSTTVCSQKTKKVSDSRTKKSQ